MAAFWIFWVIDLIIWLICGYETFMVRSNSSMAIPFFIISACLGLSWWLRHTQPKVALYIAGAPAGLVLLFVVIWILSMFGRSNWQ